MNDVLKKINKIPLGIFPTPLYKLENISKVLGCNVWIKRDDLTGVGLGGNKVRKLEYLLAEAKEQNAEIIFTTGGAQSNHAMLTACCSNKLGLTPILILKERGVTERKGNQLLEYLMGTDVRFMDTDSYDDIYEEMDRVGQSLGKKYYKIPCGGSNSLGSIGYVECMAEIAEQAEALGVNFNYVFAPEGSGGTHAGVALGAKMFLPGTKVTGMKVDSDPFEEITPAITKGAIDILGIDLEVEEFNHLDCCGPGYAIPSKEGNEAIKLMAKEEGIFLDPVYTGKAFGGLIKMAKEGQFKKDDNVLFLYTGGAGGLFAIDVE